MSQDDRALFIYTHNSEIDAKNFLENVNQLKLLLKKYLSDDSENIQMKLALKKQLEAVLAYHQQIRKRPTKLGASEIEAETKLKAMMGRGTESQKNSTLARLFAPLVKVIQSRKKTNSEKVFDQLLANAKFTIPVINRAIDQKVEHQTHKASVSQTEKKHIDGFSL